MIKKEFGNYLPILLTFTLKICILFAFHIPKIMKTLFPQNPKEPRGTKNRFLIFPKLQGSKTGGEWETLMIFRLISAYWKRAKAFFSKLHQIKHLSQQLKHRIIFFRCPHLNLMISDDRGGGFSWIFDLECQQTYLDVMLDHNAWHFCRKLDGVC